MVRNHWVQAVGSSILALGVVHTADSMGLGRMVLVVGKAVRGSHALGCLKAASRPVAVADRDMVLVDVASNMAEPVGRYMQAVALDGRAAGCGKVAGPEVLAVALRSVQPVTRCQLPRSPSAVAADVPCSELCRGTSVAVAADTYAPAAHEWVLRIPTSDRLEYRWLSCIEHLAEVERPDERAVACLRRSLLARRHSLETYRGRMMTADWRLRLRSRRYHRTCSCGD